MKVIRDLSQKWEAVPCALALGAFDGLHRGHRAVIAAAAEQAAQAGLALGVFTFGDNPSGAPALLTGEDKLALRESLGVQWVFTPAFRDVKDLPAPAFLAELLQKKCGVRALCCGEDFRFGRGAAGEVSLLRAWCRETGTSLTVVPPVLEGGEKISSTRIRRAVEAGDIPAANHLLGRPFGYTLEVIHGNHIGTGLGTPTVNQALPQSFILPPFGVYASVVAVDGFPYAGVTNIGVKPTVGSDRVLSETWIQRFAGDLYGRRLSVGLRAFLRPERKFPSLEELKAAIGRDAARAQALVEKEISGK